jgi:hypothetical protein
MRGRLSLSEFDGDKIFLISTFAFPEFLGSLCIFAVLCAFARKRDLQFLLRS